MKAKIFILILICILALTGCNKEEVKEKVKIEDPKSNTEVPSTPKIADKTKDEIKPIAIEDLTTEEGLREYLSGEWFCGAEYMASIVCEMEIDQNLNVHLLFYDASTDEYKEEYEGSIELRRIYASSDEGPDALVFKLRDKEYPDNEYFFLHRTVYGGKRVMSLFFAGLENSIFDKLAYVDEDYEYMNEDEYMDEGAIIQEVIFEKKTEEVTKMLPREDDWFYAVFWGSEVLDGGIMVDHIWIDDVWWTPDEEDDYARIYPHRMTLYESDIGESVLYKLDPDKEFYVLGDGGEKGEVYYIETDENGIITEMENAEYKLYLENEENEENQEAYDEVEEMIWDIITDGFVEIEEYLDMGMTVLYTGETTFIDGEECYDIALGTDHEEHFVREIHYTVNIYRRAVYRYDVIDDKWEQIGQG